MSTTTRTEKITVNGEKWAVSKLAEATGLSEQTVETTPPEALAGILENKRKAEQAQQEAQEAKKKAERKAPARKSELDKRKKKLHKFLSEYAEATETSQIIAEVVMSPWKGAKELRQEIAPDHSRTFSTPVHDAKLTLHALIELDLLDEDYLYHLQEQAK